jgi:Fe-S cluster biogenesis protein NfuA
MECPSGFSAALQHTWQHAPTRGASKSRLSLRTVSDIERLEMHTDDPHGDLEEQVQSVLAELLPSMQADGGGVELVSMQDSSATLRLVGICRCCPSRKLSAQSVVDDLLNRIPSLRAVHVEYPALVALNDVSQ